MDQDSFDSQNSERAAKAKSPHSEKLPTSKHYNATPGARMGKKMGKKESQDMKNARTEKTGFGKLPSKRQSPSGSRGLTREDEEITD
ncbi:hypothetical protein MMC29_005084 [Sticta canariensis]|nr:hypothetical protein [Sticta canariensis]